MENSEIVLVTGGTGAVAIHCILQLLQKGYSVKTTLRSINKKNEVIEMLKTGGITSFDNLKFIKADLTKDDNWTEAVKGCTYVLQVASPTHLASKDENEMIRPAVDGVLRVLKAARNAGVKRVVMTSSFGALGFSNKDRSTETTEADWTDPNEKGLSPYEKSKVLAERAAWDFIKKSEGNLELTVINPVAIFGPVLGPGKSPSFGLLKLILSGSWKAVPNIPLNVVDIRDVADLHIRAMTNPDANGQRFIASADGEISMPQIAALLKNKMPGAAKKVNTKTLPNWVLFITALFNPQAKQAVLFLKINRNVSNAKAKRIFGWIPIANNEEAILASMESMLKFGIIK
ncbi:Nucleoside-diphosphate-sugar epimerase [Mucilaginibacter pineti]|uniref:Nucleoside-diphosphate-sugar epimerase n=1 Tax=Mucilaginibacter pineti TaxID=1391627 RepID=A0A1G7E3H1_9SPHI|nr:aldehyde reductase [Mucilaginibacter pineti]SDE58159.1 Nucleoside-diphosphate-sugar epimerase [Mucilaginibacter pineti]